MKLRIVKLVIVDEVSSFIEMLSRGGFLYPSDLLYISCLHMWYLYSNIKSREDSMGIVIQTSNPRKLFVVAFIRWHNEQVFAGPLINALCSQGHLFQINQFSCS